MEKTYARNILGTPLQSCCTKPLTGFFRDGYCHTNDADQGLHVICAVLTEEFLEFTKSCGNDLSTPRPQFDFPGLRAGDVWCLCAMRWKEAHEAGVAPPIKPQSTHERTLDIIEKAILEPYYIH